MANIVAGGKTPILTSQQLQDLGFAIAAYPTMLTYAMARSMQRALAYLPCAHITAGLAETMDFEESNAIIGLNELRRRKTEFYAG